MIYDLTMLVERRRGQQRMTMLVKADSMPSREEILRTLQGLRPDVKSMHLLGVAGNPSQKRISDREVFDVRGDKK